MDDSRMLNVGWRRNAFELLSCLSKYVGRSIQGGEWACGGGESLREMRLSSRFEWRRSWDVIKLLCTRHKLVNNNRHVDLRLHCYKLVQNNLLLINNPYQHNEHRYWVNKFCARFNVQHWKFHVNRYSAFIIHAVHTLTSSLYQTL